MFQSGEGFRSRAVICEQWARLWSEAVCGHYCNELSSLWTAERMRALSAHLPTREELKIEATCAHRASVSFTWSFFHTQLSLSFSFRLSLSLSLFSPHPRRLSCQWTAHDQAGIIFQTPYTILDKHLEWALEKMKLLSVIGDNGGTLLSQMWIQSTVMQGSATSVCSALYLSPHAVRSN